MAATRPTLVTGAAGFAGSHLLDRLSTRGVELVGWYRPGGEPPATPAGVRWQAVELLDRDAVHRAIAEIRPAQVFHCAGAASVAQSWTTASTTLAVNVRGTQHLIDALGRTAPDARVLVTSSGLIYAPSDDPLHEASPMRPVGPYGVSKLAQEMVCTAAAGGPAVWIARPFNHIGPRQSEAFVASAFARQIAEIEAGRREPRLLVGNLEPRRDFMDVRDTVRAYERILESGVPGRPYNVCSGRAVPIRHLLDALCRASRVDVEVVSDPSRYRPSDTPVVLGDASRLRDELGWTAEIPLEETLRDLLVYWRQRYTRS